MREKYNLTNNVYGRLTVLRPAHVDERRKRYWHCRCECGNETITRSDQLRRGEVRSCGCLKAELDRSRKNRLNHGSAARGKVTSEYRTWSGMRSRCRNRNNVNYPEWGGRGIKVCERWDKFEVFLKDMGPKPGPTYSIDRINNDGHYEPGNCRWATKAEQAANRRPRRSITDQQ